MTNGHILHNTNNSNPVTPSQILFATNKDQGETVDRVVDSLSADVKGLPAPGNVKLQDKKQVETINAADEQLNKGMLFACKINSSRNVLNVFNYLKIQHLHT